VSLAGHTTLAAIPNGQGLKQIGEPALAFGLSSLIGARARMAPEVGRPAHAYAGGRRVGAVRDREQVRLRRRAGPGRRARPVARRGAGLTTAAIVWITAAIGMACGASLALIAILATAGHFVVVLGYPRLAAALPRSRYLDYGLRIVYEDGRGILRDVLSECTRLGFAIVQVATRQLEHDVGGVAAFEVQGQPSADPLAVAINELPGVLEVTTTDLARQGD
jgi:putative Mg2+ transporter-C (MgtC) family protein